MAESLAGPLASALAGLKPDEQATLTKEYLTKKLPGWGKLKPDEQDSLVKETVGKYGTNVPGSVMGGPPTTANRLKTAGRAMAEFTTGTALPVAANMMTEGASTPIKIGAQAVAGAATPYAEAAVSKLTGGNPSMPTWKDAARSAAFVAGLSALGAKPEAGRAEKVAGQIKGLPEEAQTVGNVKQAMRNRDFWIQSGASPEQADQIVTMPQTDLEALTQQSVKAGQDFKGAFQQVLDHQRADFKTRYDAVLGEHGATPIDPAPIAKQLETLAQGSGQHELTPTFRNFLQRKAKEIGGEEDAVDVSKAGSTRNASGQAAIRLTPEQLKKLNAKMSGDVVDEAGKQIKDINGLRSFRTELRENLPVGATNLDKQAYNQLNTQLTQEIDSKLAESGAKPEQIAAMHSLDEEYGRFQDTIKKLDPRSGKFGSQISDLLFDKQLSNPEQAVNFVRMAQAAEQAHPGEVMPQLRASFMDHVLSETKQQAQGRPVEEMRLIQNLQKQWGGDKNARAVMGAVFGADSPMANMTTASKVLGSLANPDAVAAKGAHTVLSDLAKGVTSHNFIVRLALFYGTYRAIAGGTGSPWKDLGDPEKMIPPLMAMMVGGKMADFALGAADTQIQKAYVDFLLNPNSKSLSNVTSVLGGIGGAASGRPTENAPANP